jgi:stage II sporulation protein D
MATEGHSAAKILDFYFPGTRVGLTAADHGWAAAREAGWTLWSVGAPSAELAREGNAAWAEARRLYPPLSTLSSRPQALAPEVWAMPTTELFRQETGEPGWMLAGTQGTRVVLQPEAVARRSGSEEPTLLHEFLHVLVESEAAATAPLWVREGVVEALMESGSSAHAEDGASAEVAMSFAEIEAELARPRSQAESQRAHAEAARRAQAMIAQFGLEQVRAWLRSGVPESSVSWSDRAAYEATGR